MKRTILIVLFILAAVITMGEIIISEVLYDSKAEYVELKNTGERSVNLSGWKLYSVKGEQELYLKGTLKAGKTLRIYSGPRAHTYIWTKRYIHNNKGDTVWLYNSSGKVVSKKEW